MVLQYSNKAYDNKDVSHVMTQEVCPSVIMLME